MKRSSIIVALGFFTLTSCAQQSALTPLASGGATRAAQSRAASAQFTSIYKFEGAPDGAIPEGRLTTMGGMLYGTTSDGGAAKGKAGTVFVSRTTGNVRVLYSFAGGTSDGATPEAGLTALDGTLYGTTTSGGAKSSGTVFSITKSGAEQVIYSFANRPDGAIPSSGLTDVKGTLYGTTAAGGENNHGTVFTVTPGGTEQVVYSFAGTPDADFPKGGLTMMGGVLYGTTNFGGASDLGAIYAIAANGTESVLYSFKGGTTDGEKPFGDLVVMKGALWGTTSRGGASGAGTVFTVDKSGNERVVASFTTGTGSGPLSGLTLLNGALYGVALRGATDDAGSIYAVQGSGIQAVHAFTGQDGKAPLGALLALNGALYGTTRRGGAPNKGSLFSQTP